jgi:hypothetical protein
MRRLRLIEIHEQRWFPSELRTAVTDLLQFTLNLTRYDRAVAPLLQVALHTAETKCVVDLCSGGGGPWPDLLDAMKSAEPVSVCLTDKYPNCASFERIQASSQKRVTFATKPIDAEYVPSELLGFRTLFNSFHHFQDGHAEHVLADAVQNGQGVAVFEVPRRCPVTILATCLMALAAFLFLPFVRPFSFSLFAWTYLVPVLPFVMWFDGIVSCLRSHSLSELRELAGQPVMRSHEWWCGTLRAQTSMLPVTVLIGCPKRKVNETGQSLSHLCNQHSQEQLLVASGMLTARLVPFISKNGFLECC